MSFLTEYFDEYREHPIRKQTLCRPEMRYAKLEGKWFDPKAGTDVKEMTDEEIKKFIKDTMKRLRGQSTYFNDYCADLSQDFKTRPFKPQPKKKRPCKCKPGEEVVVEEKPIVQEKKLAIKDTELMKVAEALYERDMDKPTLEPLPTHLRILGYARPCLFKTGLSEYMESIGRLAFEVVKYDRLPKYVASNGGRPKWGYPPEGMRQPELDGAPFDGERLYN